ncbi:S-adenosyl-L-methionine-dependent methyltransferase [Hypoxylon trugodes]|uniref:S-adenosyl-L-methionine-dependent methyltransferase n=1 Tax=Hypoxylon trugodes TaxID=326681 RepID=UPI0021912B51|nr:S-adenosyl-L-methionine-dependent methyltransferase [Hypoxylon trugodes]KAI1382728.1 S-adenosyl-L-methionine-dependent methyltransferase [Hypoxylon trugodes]
MSTSESANPPPPSSPPPEDTARDTAGDENPAADPPTQLEADVVDDNDSALGFSDEELSTASLRSSIREYNMLHGRGYHRDQTYFLPSDEDESDRLDLQNHQLLLTFGGKIHFALGADTAKRVLDVGTGTGLWALDFADEHPEAEVLGVDIAAIQPSFVPPNCSFEIDDLEKDWTFSRKFDYIFTRLMAGSFADWDRFVGQCYDFLEPGGWLEVIDPTLPACCDDGTLKPEAAINRWDEYLVKASKKLGRPFDAGSGHFDRVKAHGFVNVERKIYKWPINPWPKDPKFKEIGLWTRANIEGNLEGISTALLARGLELSREEILAFLAEVRAELRNPRIHAYWEV